MYELVSPVFIFCKELSKTIGVKYNGTPPLILTAVAIEKSGVVL